ncbi:MAG: glycoside hydrolase family 55 protein [Candidatus Sumerlaeia bacterium]|nr:glycoside hydrolase family 55 protein [Candidatus Sumerlaeia bacterium]
MKNPTARWAGGGAAILAGVCIWCIVAAAAPAKRSAKLFSADVSSKAQAGDPDAYLRYVHPTIREPFPDLLNLAVPSQLGNQRLAAMGFVDVTQAPFRADPTGRTDSTRAIQEAITFARDHQMICFFPPGSYRVSDTLECVQQLYRRSNGRVFGGNRFPNVLMGSRAGTHRPRIVLAANAPGFDNPAKPKFVVYFWARGYLNPTTADRVTDGLSPEAEQPNISMNQMLVNLDIIIGENNPGAIAIRHQAAEGSAIEDCTIDASFGLGGIQGGIGSGGSSTNVTVIGGRIGLDCTGYLSGTQPTPVITGFTFRSQTEAAIRSTSRQTLVAAGLKIVAERCAGPLIQVVSGPSTVHCGELTLVDSEIEFCAGTLEQPERTVVSSGRGVYLHNVYVRNATKVVVDPDQKTELRGNPDGWLRVREYAHTSRPRQNQGREYRYPVYVDGKPVEEVREIEKDQPPPADLQSRHVWLQTIPKFEWPGATESPLPDLREQLQSFPSFESAGAANVKAPPYSAKGDGRSDDTAAIQRAIDENEIVFLPKGCYRLTRTLDLKPRTKLVGAGQHLSLLLATGGEELEGPEKPAPLVRTADAADAETVLAFLGLISPAETPNIRELHWRSGGRSVFRSVEIHQRTLAGMKERSRISGGAVSPRITPPVLISGHGGGNWYNYRASGGTGVDRNFRYLLADGARGPLRFYQFSPQHSTSDAAVEFRSARNVSIFGTKYEGNHPMVLVRDCDHVRLFGHGGNAKALEGGALFIFERTPNFLFANGVDGPTKIGSRSLSHPEGSTDPRLWHMLIERDTDSSEIKLPALERPVLYRRGRPREDSSSTRVGGN